MTDSPEQHDTFGGKPDIRVGTSGYSFRDWVGPFYPPSIPKGKMLDYYQQHFDCVEINSSYYRINHPAIYYNMLKKTGDDFEFMVKTHKSFTHERKDIEPATAEFIESVSPLVEAGKLKGLLAQFPWSFKYSPENLRYLVQARGLLRDFPVFVEFRHASWVKPEVFEVLRESGYGYCNVDEPSLPGLLKPDATCTTDIGYVRLHGRNAAEWWHGGAKRYDYDYSEAELMEWVGRIEEMSNTARKIYVFFNNCHQGKAVRNAKLMKEFIQREWKTP